MRDPSKRCLFLFSAALAIVLIGIACTSKAPMSPTSDPLASRTNAKPNSLSPRDILANQPDFIAEEIFSQFEPRAHGGFSLGNKIAKKGDCYRSEFEGNVFYFRPNTPTVNYYPKKRRYAEVQLSSDTTWYRNANHVQIFANQEHIVFEETGTEVVQGHECIKITAKSKDHDKKEIVLFYAAKDLKNLVIVVEITLSDRTNRHFLRNISFDVPDALFSPIETYKPRPVLHVVGLHG